MKKCQARKAGGDPCGNPPVRGALICRKHGAGAPQVKAKAAVRAELEAWSVSDSTAGVEPDEILLRLLAQSVRRADRYGSALADVIEERGLRDGLVGDRLVLNPETGTLTKIDEYVRGLTRLEAEERDRAASFAKLAIAAGVAERRVSVAEKTGALIEHVLLQAFDDMALTEAQRDAAPAAIRRALTAVDGAS